MAFQQAVHLPRAPSPNTRLRSERDQSPVNDSQCLDMTSTTTTDVVSTAFPELNCACVIPADTDRGSFGGSDLNLAARWALWAAGGGEPSRTKL